MSSLAPHVAERFGEAICAHLGLLFDESKLGFLAEVLARRSAQLGTSPEAYLVTLEAGCSGDERRALALELTVPETYFFRHSDQFRAFIEVAVTARMARRARNGCLRVLSAGCASGEEAYSLAIMLRQAGIHVGPQATVEAIDLNPAMLEKARRGRYSAWSLRETAQTERERWFLQDGREFVLDRAIRGAVSFREANLVSAPLERAAYDVIFCRNVLMYFAAETMRRVIERFAQALAEGGYLFLGHAETLRGLSHSFHLCHTHGTFYYQRKELLEEEASPLLQERAPLRDAAPAASPAWIEAVQRASLRIRELSEGTGDVSTRTRAAPPSSAPSVQRARPAIDLSGPLALLKEERFGEALNGLAPLSAAGIRDPDAMLLEAALLTQSGQLATAQERCAQLLALDELNAGAHYLLALCREGSGDRAGAQEHDEVAIYLDPSFSMPRLHLGLMARRARLWDVAHRHLEQALILLEREEPSRLVLFGGGFGREALLALCRSEISAAGRA